MDMKNLLSASSSQKTLNSISKYIVSFIQSLIYDVILLQILAAKQQQYITRIS